jgi:hypothetical protein
MYYGEYCNFVIQLFLLSLQAGNSRAAARMTKLQACRGHVMHTQMQGKARHCCEPDELFLGIAVGAARQANAPKMPYAKVREKNSAILAGRSLLSSESILLAQPPKE